MSTIPDISIRSNFFLWLLTGRSTGFANAALNTSIDFIVNSTPEEILHARRFLKLDVLGDDFNVLAVYAASLMSKAMLRDMPYNIDAVFVPGLLALPKVVTSVPLLGRTEHAFGYVDGSAGGALGFTSLLIAWESADKAKITTSNGLGETCAASIQTCDGGFRLRVPSVERYGIFADFLVQQWNTGDYVTVELAPTRYPYPATAAKLRIDRTMMRLMNGEGTLAPFESSPDNPALQVGMAGLAIIRRMLKWTTDEQSGYVVRLQGSENEQEPLETFYSVTPELVKMEVPEVDPDKPEGFHV